MDTEKIGRFLAQLRREKHLTQEQLGQQIGVTNKTISRWEKGNYLPPADMLKRLSELYGISINELLSGQRLTENSYKEKAEENISAIIRQRDFTRREKITAAVQWLRKNWWAILLCLFPAGLFYAALPFAASDRLSAASLAIALLLTGVLLIGNHLLFHICALARDKGRADPYAPAAAVRILWLVFLGIMLFLCTDLVLALLHSLTPGGTADGYAVHTMFYDTLIRDDGLYPDSCFNALERTLWHTFFVTVINLDLAALWTKKRSYGAAIPSKLRLDIPPKSDIMDLSHKPSEESDYEP